MNYISYKMNSYKYAFIKLASKIPFIGEDLLIKCLRKEGCYIGDNTHIFSNISAGEPYLVKIGNNCTISTDVIFLTHDASIGILFNREKYSDICGKITIGNNCFIGNKSIILYGVTIPDNTIIAAGSVVTKSISESGKIVGGNPAKVIGNIEDFKQKNKPYFLNLHGLSNKTKRQILMNTDKLKQR